MFQALINDVEVSVGGFYQKDMAPRFTMTATYGTNTGIGKFTFFGESLLQYGSDKTFISSTGTLEKKNSDFFYTGTAGIKWDKTIAKNKFSIIAQYLFNGEGYDKGSKAIELMETGSPILKGFLNKTTLLGSDLKNRNKHYISCNFSILKLFSNKDLSFSTFTMANLVDGSGLVTPTISFTVFKGLKLALSSTFNFSDKGKEYYYGNNFSFKFTVSLGGGDF
jgi:hypothetical protein